MKHILITGGAGFIGSNLVRFLLETYPGDTGFVVFDKLTYAGSLDNLKEVSASRNFTFVQGDICNPAQVEKVFSTYDIRGVFHLAAESHVDNSISGPELFIRTNVLGTFYLLDRAYKQWMSAPFTYKKKYPDCRFLHVSTDEVYGSLEDTGFFTEETPYGPNSPYSASKAGSDMIVRSYYHTYGLDCVTTNCSNNYGPFQHEEKLIPTIIRSALGGKPVPIYGEGTNIRDWLYVTDHCRGLDLAFRKGRAGQTYNIGTRNEIRNIDLARLICELLDEKKPLKSGSYKEQITFVKDRPGHDKRYAIDPSKIENELGFAAAYDFETGLEKTVDYYLEQFS